MIIRGEELKKRMIKALEELSKKETYIKLQDAHEFVGEVCTWACGECKCNYVTEEVDTCKMADFLENLTKYQPSMEKVRGEE